MANEYDEFESLPNGMKRIPKISVRKSCARISRDSGNPPNSISETATVTAGIRKTTSRKTRIATTGEAFFLGGGGAAEIPQKYWILVPFRCERPGKTIKDASGNRISIQTLFRKEPKPTLSYEYDSYGKPCKKGWLALGGKCSRKIEMPFQQPSRDELDFIHRKVPYSPEIFAPMTMSIFSSTNTPRHSRPCFTKTMREAGIFRMTINGRHTTNAVPRTFIRKW